MNIVEKYRDHLRKLCDESLYTFCKVVMGYRDMTPQTHLPMCTYIQNPGRRYKLLVEPRGHLKSSVGTIGYTTWRTAKNPELRVLVTNATATNAIHFSRTIKRSFETNSVLRWLYPEVIPDFKEVKWADNEFELRRRGRYPEATVEAIGLGGTVTSRHYDIIIEDDLIAPEDGVTVTVEMIQKAVDWHKYATSLAVNPAVVEQVVIGTRWLYDDFIAYLFQNEKWYLPALYQSAYRNGKPLWPQRFTEVVLDQILEQQGPRIFSCQYLNDPVHEDVRSFDPTWFRYYSNLPDRAKLKCVTSIDPAFTQKRRSDYTAIVTVAGDSDKNRYIVDARRGRWGVDEMIDQVFEVHKAWAPVRIGLESVAAQGALMFPFREAMRRENINLPMVEIRGGFAQRRKELRIQSLHEFFANGSLWLNKSHGELLQELNGYPALTHDDMLDALAHAMRLLVYPSKEEDSIRWDPFSFEAIRAELNDRHRSAGPFVYEKSGPDRAGGPGNIPQTVEEIVQYLREEVPL